MKLTALGRQALKAMPDRGEAFAPPLRAVDPYRNLLEKVFHGEDDSIDTNQVASYWHDNFKAEVSDSDEILKDQAVCFFQLVEGAGIGKIVLGRKGAATRIDLDRAALTTFAEAQADSMPEAEEEADGSEVMSPTPALATPPADRTRAGPSATGMMQPQNNRVFITHGKSSEKIIPHLKEIVTFGKLVPVIAEEHETVSKPVPEKVLDDMRSCFAGVIHVAGEQVLLDEQGNKHHKINENVLIEIGAAMALYKRNFVLLVQKGVQLPSNLQGLYECRYEGEKLDGEATMKLLKAFNEFSA
jgi:predicted nucleotide-binding protein